MSSINLHTVTLEGVDLSGKTTLYNSIHKKTGYKWNIQDRSELSMLCNAKYYKRNDCVDFCEKRLVASLNDINKRTIILVPDLDVIQKRYHDRGDDIQDIKSLEKLYQIFKKTLAVYKKYSTVFVVEKNLGKFDLTKKCINYLHDTEKSSLHEVSKMIRKNAESSSMFEVSPAKIELDLYNSNFMNANKKIMNYELEKEYYKMIFNSVMNNIDSELEGKNSYFKEQNPYRSRRFIYTSDSCIALIHSMLRGGDLNIHVTCRSSDVRDIFRHDLEFLCYLSKKIYNKLKLDVHNCYLNLTLNSAHIPEIE